MSRVFERALTVTAHTSRMVISGTGYSSVTTPVLDYVLVSEPTPLSADVRSRLVLDTPYDMLESWCDDGLDIKDGDTLTLENSGNAENKDYPVRKVFPWPWRNGTTFKVLVLEDLKT